MRVIIVLGLVAIAVQGSNGIKWQTNTKSCTTTTTCSRSYSDGEEPEDITDDPTAVDPSDPSDIDPSDPSGLDTVNFYSDPSDCYSVSDGVLLVDHVHCRRYYVCQNGKATRLLCSIDQLYDRQLRTCRPRSLVTNCPSNRS